MTHETSPLDPQGGTQTKAHAPGVGIVEVGAINDPEGEVLVLIEINQLDAAGLDAAREAALTLDVRAYQTASAVYGGTPPLGQPRQPPPPVPPVVPVPPVPAPSPAAGVLPAATPPASTTKRKKARSKRRKCKRKRAQARARGDNVQRKKKPPRRCRRKRPRS